MKCEIRNEIPAADWLSRKLRAAVQQEAADHFQWPHLSWRKSIFLQHSATRSERATVNELAEREALVDNTAIDDLYRRLSGGMEALQTLVRAISQPIS